MKGYRLQLLRHEMTQANLDGRYIGTTDLPLCSEGTKELYSKLEKYDYPYAERVFCSPLKRCKQTAAILYPNAPVTVIDELREMDFGKFENKKAEELLNDPDYKKFMQGGLDNPPPEGESMRSVVERCYAALAKMISVMMNDELTNCAVITHGGIIMNMLTCFGLPKYPASQITAEAGGGFDIIVTAQMWLNSQAFEILGYCPYEKLDDPTTDYDYNDYM